MINDFTQEATNSANWRFFSLIMYTANTLLAAEPVLSLLSHSTDLPVTNFTRICAKDGKNLVAFLVSV